MSGKPIIAILLAVFCLPSWAEIYTWRDAQGRVHFGDKPARSVTAKPIELEKLNTMTAVDVPEDLFEALQAGHASAKTVSLPRMKKGQVVMYSTPTCRFCGVAKDYMKRKGIPYREKDITVSKSAEREFLAYGGRGVPLMLIGTPRGTKKLHGFSERRFESVYYSR